MPSLEILPQLLINGIIAGSIYALAAAGFALVYYVLKFQYFSHGAIIGLCAYVFFWLTNIKMNFIAAGIITVIMSMLFVMIKNLLIYKPLRSRKATPTILLISSVVLLIFSTSLILAIFGSSTKIINLGLGNKIFDFGIFSITAVQVSIIALALVLFALLYIILKKTKLGKAMRALSDNKDVAQVVGINPEKIYIYTFILSALMGAISGILIGVEQNLYPKMGILIIIKGFIGAVVGGLGSVPGAIIGGFFLGIAENLGIWILPSSYKDLISFTILLIFLLLRPHGILGVKARDA